MGLGIQAECWGKIGVSFDSEIVDGLNVLWMGLRKLFDTSSQSNCYVPVLTV